MAGFQSPVQLVLPLLRETAGTDHQTALQIAAGDQLLDEQPRHDGLAGAQVVGQQEAKRLPRQHGFVHRGDLVRQWLHHRGVHGEHGVEEMRKADALGLGDQAEEGAVAVEAPRPADLDDLQLGLVVTVQKLVGDLAGGRFVGQLKRFGAEPLHPDNRRDPLGQYAAYRSVGLEIFELHSLGCTPIRWAVPRVRIFLFRSVRSVDRIVTLNRRPGTPSVFQSRNEPERSGRVGG